MLNSLQSLKQLEGLVKQASEALQKSATEGRSLKEKLVRLESENKRLKDELREAKLTLARHERLKARLSRIAEKLEKVA
jgi:predicted RNase H-like nuclease (RuvC/YqgF family)